MRFGGEESLLLGASGGEFEYLCGSRRQIRELLVAEILGTCSQRRLDDRVRESARGWSRTSLEMKAEGPRCSSVLREKWES